MQELNGTVYIVSDCHFGAPDVQASKDREALFCRFLDSIKPNADFLILLGDIFDYWFDYKEVVPKGYIRLLGKLAELSDVGVQILYFTGNHDMWIKDYFAQELNAKIYRKEQTFLINGKVCRMGHGDGVGPKDYGYKLIKAIYACPVNRFLYAQLHTWLSFKIARAVCKTSRGFNSEEEEVLKDESKEYIIQHARNVLKTEFIDYFIYGHRHLPLDYPLTGKTRYLNSGDWLHYFTYIQIKNTNFTLETFKVEN